MKRLVAIGAAIAALALGSVAAYASTATVSTVSPWAYACGHTVFGNPVTQQDLPGEASCPSGDVLGNASSAYAGGELTMSKLCPGEAVDPMKCQNDDLAAGATIGGLVSLTAASYDVTGGSCSGGSPRLNVVTGDGKTHFFGCGPNNEPHHVVVDFSASADGSGNGGVSSEDVVTSIDFVVDLPGTATVSNLSFTGSPTPTPTPTATPTPTPTATPTASPTASPTATPTASPTATPTATAAPAAQLATTGGGGAGLLLLLLGTLGGLVTLAGLSMAARRRRRTA